MTINHLKFLHVIGPKKSGKTSLISYLTKELIARGYKIGTLKHSIHAHPVDKPGSDTDRLRGAGASPSVFLSPRGVGIFLNPLSDKEERELLETIYRNCDLVLVESFRSADGFKIALANGESDLQGVKNVVAVVSETQTFSNMPCFKADDAMLIDFILDKFGMKQ